MNILGRLKRHTDCDAHRPRRGSARASRSLLPLFWCWGLFAAPAHAADFYGGKTITIIVGFTAGGGYDITARLYARHWSRFIPGHPTIVVSNMPGAGSAVAATSLYTATPQDGTRLGVIAGGAVIDPLLGSQARYDARKFHWIGGRAPEPSVCALWHEAPVKKFEDVLRIETTVGASGPGSRTVSYPKLMNDLLGAKFKVVAGYPGGAEISLAMERREVDGHCGLAWGSAKGRLADWLKAGKLNNIVQFALTKAPDLPDVPLAGDLMKSENDRKAIELLESDAVLAWPLLAPPGTPPERVQELRASFEAMLGDREFLADAEKQKLDVELVPGEALRKVVEDVYATPPDVIAIVKKSME